jgi:hypothetical protein
MGRKAAESFVGALDPPPPFSTRVLSAFVSKDFNKPHSRSAIINSGQSLVASVPHHAESPFIIGITSKA